MKANQIQLLDLPNELLTQILANFAIQDYLILKRVNRIFRTISNEQENRLWSSKFGSDAKLVKLMFNNKIKYSVKNEKHRRAIRLLIKEESNIPLACMNPHFYLILIKKFSTLHQQYFEDPLLLYNQNFLRQMYLNVLKRLSRYHLYDFKELPVNELIVHINELSSKKLIEEVIHYFKDNRNALPVIVLYSSSFECLCEHYAELEGISGEVGPLIQKILCCAALNSLNIKMIAKLNECSAKPNPIQVNDVFLQALYDKDFDIIIKLGQMLNQSQLDEAAVQAKQANRQRIYDRLWLLGAKSVREPIATQTPSLVYRAR